MDENLFGLNEQNTDTKAEEIEEVKQEVIAETVETAATEQATDSVYSYSGQTASESGIPRYDRISAEQQEPSWQPGTGTAYQKPKKVRKKKEKKPLTTSKVAGICAIFMVITLLANAAMTYAAFKFNIGDYVTAENYKKSASIKTTAEAINEKNNIELATSDGSVANDMDATTLSVSEVAEEMLPAVVSITSTTIYQSNSFMFGGSYQVSGAGSGIIIATNDTELLIVTNNHVVEDTTSLIIEFVDGTTVEAAYVKGTNSSNDLAVVAVNLEDISDDTINAIRIATLGDSDQLKVGDQVVAIGNALGYGQSVTVGYVSALNRGLAVDSTEINAIQTDASINGGNSGGALVNMQGEVIGINFAKQSSNGSSSSASIEGMGYAIPISQAKDIINDLMNKAPKVEVDEDDKGYIGITSAVSIDASVSQIYNIPEGALLKGIAEGSPADKAGIQIQDVIVAVEGQEIASYEELQEEMSYHAAGDTVEITVERAKGNRYETIDFEVELCSYEELEKLLEDE